MTEEIKKLQTLTKAAWKSKNFPEFRKLRGELAHLLHEVKCQTI